MTFQATPTTYQRGAMTLPQEYYTSAQVLEAEVERLFRERWLWVVRANEIANAGDYYLFDRFGESIIITRDKAGKVRGYFNVCRHRGTRICSEPRGRFKETIQCPYHAWTYAASDGRLLGAPHMQEIEDFDKSAWGLHQAAVHEWNGWVFVSLSRQPAPFERAFGRVLERFDRFDLSTLVPVGRREYDVRANWKLILQNYNECLHCPMIHPELSQVVPYLSGNNDLVEGEVLGGYMEISAPHESATITGRACGVPIAKLSADDQRRGYYYSLFPNMMLSIHPDYVNYYKVWPVAPDRSIVVTEWLQHPDSARSETFSPAGAIDFWEATNRQDWDICEKSQLGIQSRMYAPGPYSPRESIPAAWDRAYLKAMA